MNTINYQFSTINYQLRAFSWLALCAALGLSMAFLFDDACQQDGPLHFLFARWAWRHPALFVDVWSRPLFTGFYSFPALIGYRATRLFTVAISLAIAWQTGRLASDLGLARAPLAIGLVWMQPSFFLFSAENMTEPIFALVYVIALRLHHRGWIRSGMLAASLMILARPEGLFLGMLWGVWVIFGIGESGPRGLRWKRVPATALLATGVLAWCLAAWALTGDPLFLKHNWPANWPLTGTIYGAAGLLAYPARLPEVVGPLLLLPFFWGLFVLLRRRRLPTMTSSFLVIFLVHTVLRAYGMLGSAGYPRYCITIAPAIAILTLAGWNEIAALFAHVSPPVRRGCAAVILGLSLFLNFAYADGAEMSRDARAINQAHAWFREHELPVTRFVWSQPYACIRFARDPWEQPTFTHNREQDLQLLREMPAGTLVYWDARIGPQWFGLRAEDFLAAGYRQLYSESHTLRGYVLDRSWFGYGGPRRQTTWLFVKP